MPVCDSPPSGDVPESPENVYENICVCKKKKDICIVLLTLRERDLELRPPAARVLLVRHVAELELVGGPEVFSGVVLKLIVCENSKCEQINPFSPSRFRSILRRAS